jgi:uroporphyrinogen decarboxylase
MTPRERVLAAVNRRLGDRTPADYGTQRALLISVPMFREFLAPYLKRMIDVCHAAGVKFMLHSCGAIRPLIPV